MPILDRALLSALEVSTAPSRASIHSHPLSSSDPHHPIHSVSVLQWLCNADSTSHSPPQRLLRFFTDLFGSLSRGSRAVFQFYPESDEQVTFIMGFATRAGFGGGLCVDYVRSFSQTLFATNTFRTPAQLVQEVPPTSLASITR